MPSRTPPPEGTNDFLNTAASGFFLFWSIPSIYFFYEVIKSLINNEKVDGLYLIFCCINLFIMFICLFPLFMKYLFGIDETPPSLDGKTNKKEESADNNV